MHELDELETNHSVSLLSRVEKQYWGHGSSSGTKTDRTSPYHLGLLNEQGKLRRWWTVKPGKQWITDAAAIQTSNNFQVILRMFKDERRKTHRYIHFLFFQRAEILKFNPPTNYTTRITVFFFFRLTYILDTTTSRCCAKYPYRKHFAFYDPHLHPVPFIAKNFTKKRIDNSTKSLGLHNFYLPTSPESFFENDKWWLLVRMFIKRE